MILNQFDIYDHQKLRNFSVSEYYKLWGMNMRNLLLGLGRFPSEQDLDQSTKLKMCVLLEIFHGFTNKSIQPLSFLLQMNNGIRTGCRLTMDVLSKIIPGGCHKNFKMWIEDLAISSKVDSIIRATADLGQ
jgi:hypothetical protein